jgi:hypothetical protein
MARRISTIFAIFFIAITTCSLLSSSALNAPEAASITLNPAIRYQTIEGWEAVSQSGETDCPGFNTYKNALFDAAVNDLGINRLRVEIRPYNSTSLAFNLTQFDNKMDNIVVPMRQRLMAKGEHLFINVNFSGDSGFTQQPDMSAYAQQVLLTYQHMQSKYGFLPDSWEVVLEPGPVSANWTAAKIDDAIIRSNSLLQANGFTHLYFIAPSMAKPDESYDMFASTMSDSMIKDNNNVLPPNVKEFSYHRYNAPGPDTLQKIANLRSQYGINTAMLEHGGGTYQELHADLEQASVSSWQQYTLAYCWVDNGYQYYVVNGNSFTIGSRTKFLRQYFKFIKPGAVRFQANSNNGAFDPLAFINPDGNDVVVVKASNGDTFSINGLKPGVYGIKYTTNTQYDVDLPDAAIGSGQSLSANIPAAGVITIYAKSSSPLGTPTPLPPGWKSSFMPMIIGSSTNTTSLLQQSDLTFNAGSCTGKSNQP